MDKIPNTPDAPSSLADMFAELNQAVYAYADATVKQAAAAQWTNACMDRLVKAKFALRDYVRALDKASANEETK